MRAHSVLLPGRILGDRATNGYEHMDLVKYCLQKKLGKDGVKNWFGYAERVELE